MKSFDNGLETLVIKYTLVGCFVGVTALFVGKIAVLAYVFAQAKIAAVHAHLTSGGWLLRLLTEGRLP